MQWRNRFYFHTSLLQLLCVGGGKAGDDEGVARKKKAKWTYHINHLKIIPRMLLCNLCTYSINVDTSIGSILE